MDVQGLLGGGAGSKCSVRVGTGYEALNGTLKGAGRMDEPADALAAGEALPSPPPSPGKRPRPRLRPSPRPDSPSSAHQHTQSRPISSLSLAESFSSPPPPAYDSLLPSSPPSPSLSRPASPASPDVEDAQLDDLITLTRSLLLSSQAILRDGEDVRESLERIVRSGSPPRIPSGFLSESGRVERGGRQLERGCEEEGECSEDSGGSGVVVRRAAARDAVGHENKEARDAADVLAVFGGSSRGRRRTVDDVSPANTQPQPAASKPSTAHGLLSRVAQRQGAASRPTSTAAAAFDTSSTFDLRTPPSPPETPVKVVDRSASSVSLLARRDTAYDSALRPRSSRPSLADFDPQADLEPPARPAPLVPVSTPPDTPRRFSQVAEPSTPSSITSSQFSSSSRRPVHHRRTSAVSSATTSSTFTSTHRSATTASLSLSSFDELLKSSPSSGTMSSDSTQRGGQSQARDRLKALVDGPAVAAEKGAAAEGGEKAAASSSWWGWRQG
ncbi:hypothetical protein JCM10296v2_001449 [Rhodotorula toruloides]